MDRKQVKLEIQKYTQKSDEQLARLYNALPKISRRSVDVCVQVWMNPQLHGQLLKAVTQHVALVNKAVEEEPKMHKNSETYRSFKKINAILDEVDHGQWDDE